MQMRTGRRASAYQAKTEGRDRIVAYDCAMHVAMVERVALERDLRHALERDQLRLAFQPIVDLASGAGHSSLQYLQRLPIDTLKIAKPFVDELAAERGDGVLAEAILNLARSFGLRVIAEGIEVDAQRARLLELGCRAGQGFLFSRPLDPPAFAQLVAPCAGVA